MSTTWAALAGDTSEFAVELAFINDPEDHVYDEDEKSSWGRFTIWANNVNLTEHIEQGESLKATHWYLLPLLEWVVESWDAIFHEERLPLFNAGKDAAEAMTHLALQPLGLAFPASDEFDRLAIWQEWWSRHNIAEASSGGLFPDVYFRRWGDLLEVSTGLSRQAGMPRHFSYASARTVEYVPIERAAVAMHDVVSRAAQHLLGRRPQSVRLAALVANCQDLLDPDGLLYARRLAFVSGALTQTSDLQVFRDLWNDVESSFSGDASEQASVEGLGRTQGGLVIKTAPLVALLFGSLAPSIDSSDVNVLLSSLHNSAMRAATHALPSVELVREYSLSSGEEGSLLGERAFEALVRDDTGVFVDIEAVLAGLHVSYEFHALSDPSTRGVSVVSNSFAPHIVVNSNYRRGVSNNVRRFTLAHELAHLLLDRDRSQQMAVASGPWAPKAIEQRANAFAAAFLMPERLLRSALEASPRSYKTQAGALWIAARLQISLSSLADRMYNLLMITREEADSLRAK